MLRISINTSQRKERLKLSSNELDFYTVRVEPEIHGKLGRLCLFGWQAHLMGQNFSIVVTRSVFVTRNRFHKLHNWSVYIAQKPAVVSRCPALLSNGRGFVVHVSPFHGTLHEMKATNFLSHFSSVICIRTDSGIFKEEYRIRKILFYVAKLIRNIRFQ